ncbi:MAG: anti-sigma factor [Actinobacteria bacterium]|nr:anti-sigma factor [Actinomycetota bacterium]
MSDDAQGSVDPFDAPLPELAFLGPNSDGSESGLPDQRMPDQRMPRDVWERLAAAIAAEPQLVVSGPLATVTAMSPRRRTRWVSGLVAASVAFLALGVVVQAVRTPSPEVVVADAATKGMTSDQAGATQTEATQAEATKLDSAPLESGEPNTMAGVSGQTMPARQVVASGITYSRSTMQDQIGDLFDRIGVADARAMDSIVQETPENLVEGNIGFTASVDTIRACIASLIPPDDLGTVVIDRAKFEQQEVGLILDLTPNKTIKAWLVGLDCGQGGPSIMLPIAVDLAEQAAP